MVIGYYNYKIMGKSKFNTKIKNEGSKNHIIGNNLFLQKHMKLVTRKNYIHE